MIKENLFKDRESLYDSVTKQCIYHLNRGIEQNGTAGIVVPGGTTPAPIFEKLSQTLLPWENVLIAPSDERWIPTEHKQSNQHLIENHLLINHAANAQLVPLKNSAKSAILGEKIAEEAIAQFKYPFDVVLVGMGNDGHFASLFPDCPQISQALDESQSKKCIAINANGSAVAGEFTERISMTLSTLLNSQLIIVLITGQQKLNVIRQASKENNSENCPVSALIKQQKTPVEIFWAE